MKEVVIISGKGGSGKTSISASLVHLSKHCVLCDCDVETPNLGILMKASDVKTEPFFGFPRAFIDLDQCIKCGLCMEKCHFSAIQDFVVDTVACEGCQFCYLLCPVDAIEMKDHSCGQIFTAQTEYGTMFHARLYPGDQNSGKLVADLRQKAKQYALKENEPLIITDGPPGVGCPVIASLTGCDLAVIVAEPSLAAIHDMKRAEELCLHFGLQYGLIINKADINPEKTRQLQEYCSDRQIPLFGTLDYNRGFRDAVNDCLPPSAYSDALQQLLLPVWRNVEEKLLSLPASGPGEQGGANCSTPRQA